MANTCTICNHPERAAIEQQIVAGTSNRAIACHFEVGRMAVARHKENCIKPAIEVVQAERKEQFVWNVLEEMQWLHQEVRAVHEQAKSALDYSATVRALGEARQQTKLFSELLSGQEPGQAEKLEQEWITVREAIFNALEPYPEARLAVAEALFALSRGGDDHDASRQLLEAPASEDSS